MNFPAKTSALTLIFALAATPSLASARGYYGGGGGGYHGGATTAPNQGRGFNMSHDAPETASGKNGSAFSGSNGSGAYNKNTGNAATYNKNTGTATTYNKSTNTTTTYNKNNYNSTNYNNSSHTYNNSYNTSANTYHGTNGNGYNSYNSAGYNGKNSAGYYNKNTGNMTVYNKNTGTTSTYHYNSNGTNGYYYNGHVYANPVYVGPAWGWNAGVVWAPYGSYWGGGFWGPFAVGAATAVVMGTIIYNNQTYTSYKVAESSPGAKLLASYQLQQTPCGPPGLVVIYGPNFGIICAHPNSLVGAGNYAVNVNDLTIQSQ
jgi:hypothetical protein